LISEGDDLESRRLPPLQLQLFAGGDMAALQKTPIAAVAIAAVASLVGIGGFSPNAHAACTPDGTTLNCTGNITGDLFFDGFQDTSGSYTTYNFFDITDPVPIQPQFDSGIYIQSPTDATDLVVTTDAAILTTSANAISLDVLDGFITLENSGDLTSSNAGIYVFSKENTTPGVSGALVTNHGDIAADASGLWARATEGDVTVINTGDITAAGNAIVVQTAGNAFVTNSGDLSGGSAVLARGVGTNDVTLQSGTANGSTYGVRFESGTTNTLNNSATLSGGILAVIGAGGDDTVNNDGTINGSVNLGAGTNAFNNLFGGTFRPTHSVSLGAGNKFTNAGTLSPGGTGTAQVTTVTGDFEQTGTGTFAVDVDEGAATEADRINVSGTAAFAGTILPNVIALTSETGQLTIATATALTSTATVTNVGGYDFSLLVDGGTNLLLSWAYAPSPDSVLALLVNANANQRAIAVYLDTLVAAGPTAAQRALIDALLALGETDLISALNQLTPELYSDAQISTLYASQGFANNLLSCKVNGPGTASIIAEGQCLWAGASATFLSQDTTFNQLGFHETTGSFAAGAQVALDDNWRLGFGAGYQSTSVSTATNATSDGNTGQAGLALKYNVGSMLIAGTVSGGRAWYDTTRPVAFTGFSGTAESDSTIDFLNGGVRLAYVFGSPQLYFKPVLDAAATRVDLGGFTETGGGAANLVVQGTQQTVYTIAPSLEVGSEWWWANGTLVRPFLRGGVTFYEGNDFGLSAAFAGAPTGISPFTIHTDMDDVMGLVGAGLDMITAEDTALRLSYDGQLGETTQIHALGVKGSVSF
jgi:uncharacterized protein with beta-barrel porin domain